MDVEVMLVSDLVDDVVVVHIVVVLVDVVDGVVRIESRLAGRARQE